MNGFRHAFAVPCLLATATLLGLVVALVGEGATDAFSWALLSAPIVTALAAIARARHK